MGKYPQKSTRQSNLALLVLLLLLLLLLHHGKKQKEREINKDEVGMTIHLIFSVF